MMIYSYNKTNEKPYYLKFIFGIKLYMFRTVSICVHHQESNTVHTVISIGHTGFADCLLAVIFQKQIWEISAFCWFYYKSMN